MTRLALLAPLVFLAAAEAAEPGPPTVRLEQVEGDPLRGRLVAIDADAIRLESEGVERAVPLDAVRRIVRDGPENATTAAVLVTTTDGGTVSGDDFLQDGQRALVMLGAGRIELPIDRVRRVAWLAGAAGPPDWTALVPERPTADLVVVRRDEGHAFVECAIAGVSKESVSVVLDGETIPVKRAKVLGIEWLREAVEAGGTIVEVAGGRLAARSVRWSPREFVLDDAIHLPPEAVRGIDYAAGRTIWLANVPRERSSFEPFFGGLAEQPGLAAFFAPRLVPSGGDGPAVLVVRPRTVAAWRVPADSRRFRGSLVRDVPAQAAAAVDVSIAIDESEVFRRRLGGTAEAVAEPVALDLDLAGGRRLTLTVDFAAGDLGCGVRLVGGAFEK